MAAAPAEKKWEQGYQIAQLVKEINRLHYLLNHNNNGQFVVPAAVERAFQSLNRRLQAKEKECEMLQSRLEVAIASSKPGELDVKKKILAKAQSLEEENETLGRMLYLGPNSDKSLQLEIEMLRKDNENLRQQVAEYQAVCFQLDEELQSMMNQQNKA